MPEEPDEQDQQDKSQWKERTAVAVLLGGLALVAYVTIRTNQIPANIMIPLILAAAFGLWTFRASDFTGGGK